MLLLRENEFFKKFNENLIPKESILLKKNGKFKMRKRVEIAKRDSENKM